MKNAFLVMIAAAFVLWASPSSAGVLIYNYSSTQKDIQSGSENLIPFTGRMFYDQTSSDAVFVEWVVPNVPKYYFIRPAAIYWTIPITGTGTRRFTAMSQAPPPNLVGDPDATQYLGSPFFGQNSRLKIATGTFVSFPLTFTRSDTVASFSDAGDPAPKWTKRNETVTFAPVATQSCNNRGQTLDEAVNEFTLSLKARGFQGP